MLRTGCVNTQVCAVSAGRQHRRRLSATGRPLRAEHAGLLRRKYQGSGQARIQTSQLIHTYICIRTFIFHSLVSQMLIHEYIHQWLSDDDCPSLAKILLLRVDQIDQDVSMAAQRLEEVTYNVFGINDGYEGGDKHRFESSCWVLRYFPS